MAPYHQIRKLKDQNENLRRDNFSLRLNLSSAENEIKRLETRNEDLEYKIDSLNFKLDALNIQLEKTLNQVKEYEILLQEKDETIAEYLKEINQLDLDANSSQACPNCFKDMKHAIENEGSCWVQFEHCGHRTCYECFDSLPEAKAHIYASRHIHCGICGEEGGQLRASSGPLGNGTLRIGNGTCALTPFD